MPSRLPGRRTRRWRRLLYKWPLKGTYVYVKPGRLLIVCRGFRGWCTGVGAFPLPAFSKNSLEVVLQVYLTEVRMRKITNRQTTPGGGAATDTGWAKDYPTLLAFLTDRVYDQEDGGGARQLGAMTWWCEGGFWHAKLTDHDSSHVCYVAGLSVEELLLACDAACADPGGGWKPQVVPFRKTRK